MDRDLLQAVDIDEPLEIGRILVEALSVCHHHRVEADLERVLDDPAQLLDGQQRNLTCCDLHFSRRTERVAQAVQLAGSLEPDTVIKALNKGTFDTVLGQIGFDDKGDVTGMSPFVWYVFESENYVRVK